MTAALHTTWHHGFPLYTKAPADALPHAASPVPQPTGTPPSAAVCPSAPDS